MKLLNINTIMGCVHIWMPQPGNKKRCVKCGAVENQ